MQESAFWGEIKSNRVGYTISCISLFSKLLSCLPKATIKMYVFYSLLTFCPQTAIPLVLLPSPLDDTSVRQHGRHFSGSFSWENQSEFGAYLLFYCLLELVHHLKMCEENCRLSGSHTPPRTHTHTHTGPSKACNSSH